MPDNNLQAIRPAGKNLDALRYAIVQHDISESRAVNRSNVSPKETLIIEFCSTCGAHKLSWKWHQQRTVAYPIRLWLISPKPVVWSSVSRLLYIVSN